MDFALLAELFAREGLTVSSADGAAIELEPERLARAEAAARVDVTRWLEEGHSTEAESTLPTYIEALFRHLGAAPGSQSREQCFELAATLKEPNTWDALWSQTDAALHGSSLSSASAASQLIVVSNADGTVGRKLANAGFGDAFDVVLDSHDVGFEKPDPRIFEVALQHAGCASSEALHVGDLPPADYVGAQAAGCHACIVDPYGDWIGAKFPTTPDLATLCRELLDLEES
jgi:HAD superfamily hydrolase (TIGR01549 family)